MTERYHVVPLDDLKPHLESGTYCACEPAVRPGQPGIEIVVHNAWDGREFFEEPEPTDH